VLALSYAPDGDALAVGSFDGSVRLWDPLTRKQKAVLGRHARAVFAVAHASGGHTVASAGTDGCVCLWDSRRPGRPLNRPEPADAIRIEQLFPRPRLRPRPTAAPG
jgi:WD40 repeat protein